MARDSNSCAELYHIAARIHDQVFLIDELLERGCHPFDGKDLRNGDHRIYNAINKIRDLIDWAECRALKRYIDLVEKAEKSPAEE